MTVSAARGFANAAVAFATWFAFSENDASAAEPPAAPSLDVSYSAPETCPSQEVFEAAIRKRTMGLTAPRDDSSTPEHLDVHLRSAAAGFRGRLVVRERSGRSNLREIDGATCDEAVEGLALVVALMFDPGAESRAPPPASSPEPVNEAPRAVTRRERRSNHLSLATSVLALTGQSPHTVPGGELAAAFEAPLSERFELVFQGGARVSAPDTTERTEGNASFKWWAITASVCPAMRTASGSAFVAACAAAEQGELEATGSDTRNPRSATRSWTSLGPGITALWTAMPPLFATASIDAIFPLRRDRFVLGTEDIHEVPNVALRAGIGVGVRIW